MKHVGSDLRLVYGSDDFDPQIDIFHVCTSGGAAASGSSGAVGGAVGGAAGGQERSNTPVNDKSFESEMMDEGLDLSHMSQSREVSMFTGPYLNISEEEVVLGKMIACENVYE